MWCEFGIFKVYMQFIYFEYILICKVNILSNSTCCINLINIHIFTVNMSGNM